MLSWLAIFSNANVFVFGPPKGIVFIRITYTSGSYRTYENNLNLVESKNQTALQKQGLRSEDAESAGIPTSHLFTGL
jgi:hypothetical protein